MTVAIVIPARYASTRFPGKPLHPLRGATGEARSLIERTWDIARQVDGVATVAIATDDARIAEAAAAFGGTVAMTSEDCENGTVRCADALDQLPADVDIIVNLQGDAPLTPPSFVTALIDRMRSNPELAVATPVLRCDAFALKGFQEDRRAGRVGATTAVFSRAGRALYFSKEVIPFTDGRAEVDGVVPVFHHVGVYAYRRSALAAYPGLSSGPLEALEGLEQLRFLENDIPVQCVEVDAQGALFWELNNPEDVDRIETVLRDRGTS